MTRVSSLKRNMQGYTTSSSRRRWKKKTNTFNVPNTVVLQHHRRSNEENFVNVLRLKSITTILFGVFIYFPAMFRLHTVQAAGGFEKAPLFQAEFSTYVYVVDCILVALAVNATKRKSCIKMWVYKISTFALETLPLAGLLFEYSKIVAIWLLDIYSINDPMLEYWEDVPHGPIVYLYVISQVILQYTCQVLSLNLTTNWKRNGMESK